MDGIQIRNDLASLYGLTYKIQEYFKDNLFSNGSPVGAMNDNIFVIKMINRILTRILRITV